MVEKSTDEQIHKEAATYSSAEDIGTEVRQCVSAEIIAENTAVLIDYLQQLNRLPVDVKGRCSWGKIVARFSEAPKKLELAQKMQGGGELVGVDSEGRALFKDRGVEPVMYGYDKGGELLRIYDRDPEQMKRVVRWANYFEIRAQVQKDGYEFFAENGNFCLSDEMEQVEAHTEEPFVASEDKKEARLSWLESSNDPFIGTAKCAYFLTDDSVVLSVRFAWDRDDYCGVVRLLRV